MVRANVHKRTQKHQVMDVALIGPGSLSMMMSLTDANALTSVP